VLVASLLCGRGAIEGLRDVLGVDPERTDDRWRRVADGGMADPVVRAEAAATLEVARASIEGIRSLDPPGDVVDLLEGIAPVASAVVSGR
jgi:hypothetical protein